MVTDMLKVTDLTFSRMPYYLPSWEAQNSHIDDTIKLNPYTDIHYYSIYVQHEASIPTTM